MPWMCYRQKSGVKCRHRNPNVKRKCVRCGGAKPAKVRPKHMAALDFDYAYYVALNGGEHCGICGRAPSAKRRLDRDHCHRTGTPRGVLCWKCNAQLKGWMTPSWLAAAAAYLARSAKEGTATTDVSRVRLAEAEPREGPR